MLLLNLQFVYSVGSVQIYLLPTLACEFSLISMLSPIFPRELPRRSPLQICRIGLQDRHARSRFPHLPLKGRVERNFPFTVTLYIVHVIWYKISSWCLPYHCNIQPPAAIRVFRKFNLLLVHSTGCFFSRGFCWEACWHTEISGFEATWGALQVQHNPTLLT